MGAKRTRTGNHFHFCIALVIYLAVIGCAVPETTVEPFYETPVEIPDANQDLVEAQRLLAAGKYQASLKMNERILAGPAGPSRGDEALFNMGVIFAHPANPARDYQRSAAFFKRLTREYPYSSLKDQARTWMEVLEENIKLKRASSEALQENARLKQIIEQSKKVDIEIEEKKREEKR